MLESKAMNYLVELGESSRLKVDLNNSVASLYEAPENHFRPHVCLNGLEGVDVIKKIANKLPKEE